MLRRLIGRGSVAAGIVLIHHAVGSWLVGLDPIAELIAGQRVPVAAAIALLVPLRALCWFVLVPWIVGGSVADWLARAPRTEEPP